MTTPQYPKRPGSPLGYQSLPPAKAPRLGANQLQINYLVRQKQETLPLVTEEERMTRILQLIGEYDGVLQRHESMAGNLGAVPLGPILLKRFERLFDGPPRVLKSHAKDPNITWLDVVEFAQNRPEQFNLEKQRNGVRVCQFYHKQCRVEISEEDHVLIASGMPQKLIPPQPILEDEEKELGVMEILERNLCKIFQMADQVSARARQLNHKLKTRRAAILARREVEGDPAKQGLAPMASPMSPLPDLTTPGATHNIEQPQSPPVGFTPVNIRHPLLNETDPRALTGQPQTLDQNILAPGSNGRPSTISGDNLSKFLTDSERQAGMTEDSVRRASLPPSNREPVRQMAQTRTRQEPQSIGTIGLSTSEKSSPSVAIPGTPASLLPQVKPAAASKDDGGPFKVEMIARMESVHRGDRILPPCDRCRRLQMDCIKNLTACQGCTKKHAKCSWKDVSLEELNSSTDSAHPKVSATPVADSSTIEPNPHNWDLLQENPKVEPPRPPDPTLPQKGTIEADPTSVQQATTASSTLRHSFSESSPKLDVRPPPIEQQIREASNEKSHNANRYHGDRDRRASGHASSEEDGDRLQELARKIYRSASASQGTRPPSS